MRLPSDLWLDQPDAHDRIEARRTPGALSAEEAEKLHGFVDHGYTTISLGLDKAFCDAMDEEIAGLWRQRPADLAVSAMSAQPMSFRDYEGPVGGHGYRIPDLHSHSPRARDLYLHPALFRMVELIFDQPAVAFQSLYFEYGSAQGLHRDPMFVPTHPRLNLCAAWIALEDITADSGPLAYVPGSHRLPWFEFAPGTIRCLKTVPQDKRAEFAAWLRETMAKHGLERQAFTCQRGDAFIWHGGLVHGGEVIGNPDATRKSFVVHYSTAADYKSRTAWMDVREDGGWRRIGRTTEEIIERDGARGVENPVRGRRRPSGPARLAQRAKHLLPWRRVERP